MELVDCVLEGGGERVEVEELDGEREALVEAEEDTVEVALPLPFELGVPVREEVVVLEALALVVPVRLLVVVRDTRGELVDVFERVVLRVDVGDSATDLLGRAVSVAAKLAIEERVPVAVLVAERLAVAVSVGRIASI